MSTIYEGEKDCITPWNSLEYKNRTSLLFITYEGIRKTTFRKIRFFIYEAPLMLFIIRIV